MALNKDLLDTSEIYRGVVALDCFSDEIEELEKKINELKEMFNSESYLPDIFKFVDDDGIEKAIRYDKEFYPWEHIPREKFEQQLLKDVFSGFWGEPFIV